ncbi:MAG: SDR family oxidoreductase [Candidatus Cloacimonetes bacterium]|nr:SDR family oxidoreductase [Candidatus Cloacimonadota bacterium]
MIVSESQWQKKNKAIIITGANGNVGSYFARKFLESDENLILLIHKSEQRLQSLQQKFTGNLRIIKVDLTDISLLQNKLSKVVEETGWQPDRLIHTATKRSHDFKPLADTDPELWKQIVLMNLVGAFNILKCVLPFFRKNEYGKIVLFGSNVTRIGLPKGSAYSAAKAGIANISRTLAAEEAKNNIIINTVSPGPIKIDDSQFSESYRKFREEYYNEKIRDIPLKRCASFDDLLGLCKFLLSKENSYITGEEFFITGGKI